MKKIIKYFEFFDTEDIKLSHEIEVLSKNLSKYKVIRDFNTQSPLQKFFGTLTYKYSFFKEVITPNKYVYLKETPSEPKIYFFNFKNEQCLITFGIQILNNKTYDIYIVYTPEGLDINDYGKWITVQGQLLDIYRNKIVNQEFKNLNMNQIYHKIDRVLIPIFKEFGFENLLKSHPNSSDMNRN